MSSVTVMNSMLILKIVQKLFYAVPQGVLPLKEPLLIGSEPSQSGSKHIIYGCIKVLCGYRTPFNRF